MNGLYDFLGTASIFELEEAVNMIHETRKTRRNAMFYQCRKMQHELELQNTQVARVLGMKKRVLEQSYATGTWYGDTRQLVALHDLLLSRCVLFGIDTDDFK